MGILDELGAKDASAWCRSGSCAASSARIWRTFVGIPPILPDVLRFIESSRTSLPHVGLSVQHDLDVAVERTPRAAPIWITREDEQAKLLEKHRYRIRRNVAENRGKLEELKRMAPCLRVLAARVDHESRDLYKVEFDLELTS